MPVAFSDSDLDRFDNPPDFTERGLGLPSRAAHRSSLRDQVTEAIRAALISGRMKPGVLYSAPALAELLGVSATPVREAMLDLAKEDLVTPVRNKGFRVTELSDRELDELIETRLLLEVPTMGAVAAAYQSSMDPEIARLRGLAGELELAAETDDITRYLQLDTEFHTSFLALHGNAQIVRTVRQLRSRSRLFGLEALARAGKLMESTREHARMIDLTVAGDQPGVEDLTRIHLSHARTIWATRT